MLEQVSPFRGRPDTMERFMVSDELDSPMSPNGGIPVVVQQYKG